MRQRDPLMRRGSWRARQIVLWVLVPTVVATGWGMTHPAERGPGSQAAAGTAQAEEQTKRLVVMLRGTLAEQSFNGSGIIVGRTPDRVYIATALHVVRQGTQQADPVEAQFLWLPGEWKKATVLADGDVDLDLAVVGVDAREFSIPELPWATLADPSALKPGGKVFPIGFPNAMPWFRPQQAHVVNGVTAQQIRTEGQVFPGNSGGALVTDDWRLVGLVSNVTAVLAGSTRIDLVVEKLKEWRYPVSLTLPTSATPPKPDPQPKDAGSPFASCTVSGVVLDVAGRRPLAGVNVGLVARPAGGGDLPIALERTAAITARDGTFSFTCPRGIARERFPLELIVWHTDWRTQRTNVHIQADEQRANVEIRVSVPTTTADPAVSDDCVPIRAGALRVEYHEQRGGWHVVGDGPRGGLVLLPDFEGNRDAAQLVARILAQYNVTQYCQIGRPPAVFYFLSGGAPVLASTRTRGGTGGAEVERCRPFNPAALAVVAPDSMTGADWSIRESGRIIFRVSDQDLGRRALAIIARHGFSSVCYPGRPMSYLR